MEKIYGFCAFIVLVLVLAAPVRAEQWFTVRINCSSPMTKNVENIQAKDARDAAKKIEVIMKNNEPYKSSRGCAVYELKAQ